LRFASGKSLSVHATLLALAAIGCEAFDASLIQDEADAGPGCDLQRPPPRPRGADGDDGVEYFFALRDLTIDQTMDRWTTIGYDLDGRCSYGESPDVECLPPSAAAPPETDGEGGLDNVLGHQLVPLFLVAIPGLAGELREYQTRGIGVTLVTIRGWNGEDDDARVEAIIAQSAFGTPVVPKRIDSWSQTSGTLQVNGEDWPLPEWDGTDHWWAGDENYLLGDPEQPLSVDTNAYVADRTLVMRIVDRFPIRFSGDVRETQFLLTDATFTLTFTPENEVDFAVLAGRFGITDLLSTLPTSGACPGSMDYNSVELLTRLAADVMSVPGSGGPGVTCTALSVGMRYDSGSRATFGGVVEGFEPVGLCSMMDGGVDGGAPDGGVGTLEGGMEGGT
jgi:hypothetical protein